MMKKTALFAGLVAMLAMGSGMDQVDARGRYGGGAVYARGPRGGTYAASYHTAATRPVGGYYRPAVAPVYRHPVATGVGVAAGTALRVGYRTPYLPAGYTTLALGGATYYTYGGYYYNYDDSAQTYTVVQPPLGATVNQLPSGATLVSGTTNVYVYNGVYYRPSYENGSVVYVVSNP